MTPSPDRFSTTGPVHDKHMAYGAVRLPTITVVILTANRPSLLERAITSIETQDYPGSIEVIVVAVDDDHAAIETTRMITRAARVPCVLQTIPARSAATLPLELPWVRVACQRNAGVAAASGELIAHLDDDNRYHPSHISSLAKILAANPEVSVAHSWRRLLWPDGTPYTEPIYPWPKNPDIGVGRYVYAELQRLGVYTVGSCEMRDALTHDDGSELLTVDSSEWLIRRPFHLDFPFQERLSFREASHGLTDDYLFCKRLVEVGIQAHCSRRATLDYYLGGTSTAWLTKLR